MTEAPVPLARLFAMAFRDLIDDLHARLTERGWHDHRPAFGFALVAARDGPTDATALAGLLGVTKQAASKLVDSLVAAGLVERSVGAADARRRPVAITDRGRRLLAAAEEIYAELEAEWAGVVGRDDVEGVRATLATVLRARHGGALPPVRPTW